jgi:hypothetical protein
VGFEACLKVRATCRAGGDLSILEAAKTVERKGERVRKKRASPMAKAGAQGGSAALLKRGREPLYS